MEQVIGLIAVVGFFSSVIAIAYLFFNSRHKIRMALIEHNKDASIFKSEFGHSRTSALKYGMVAVGVGLGLFIGNALENAGWEAPVPYFSMMLILGGAGLILYYLFVKPKMEGDDTV
jgi:hypothetical protein